MTKPLEGDFSANTAMLPHLVGEAALTAQLLMRPESCAD